MPSLLDPVPDCFTWFRIPETGGRWRPRPRLLGSCRLLLALLGLCLRSTAATAQAVTLEGPSTDPAVELLAEILATGSYRLIDRDTVLPPGVERGDLVLMRARVAVEGRIEGRVAVVQGDLFLRADASITGPIAILDGGFVRGARSSSGEVRTSAPAIRIRSERTHTGFRIEVTEPPESPLVRLSGLGGFGVPRYDRVDGLSLPWGGSLTSRRSAHPLEVHGAVTLHTGRSGVGGLLEVELQPSHAASIVLRASRSTETEERWIRGTLQNSLAALLFGSDVRNYYESDALSLEVRRRLPGAILTGEGFLAPRIRARISRDRSLAADNPWALIRGDETWRPNPAIDEGVLASLLAGVEGGWRGRASRLEGALAAEWAPEGVGDFPFTQLQATGRGQINSLFQHRVTITGHLLLPVGSREAPRQRWSFVGGPGTLPTFETGAMRGDHLVFIHSVYRAPLHPLRLPWIGTPALRLTHAAGAAWVSGEGRPPLEQNLGVGVAAGPFTATFYFDPAGPRRTTFSLGLDRSVRPEIF